MSQKLSVVLQESDIADITRAGPKQHTGNKSQLEPMRHRPITVKLTRKAKRDELLSAARMRRNISTENITNTPPTLIYINERLTKENRVLFRASRSRARAHGFRYCWLRNGAIFVRKAENGNGSRNPAIRIHSLDDLEKHVGPVPTSTFVPETVLNE